MVEPFWTRAILWAAGVEESRNDWYAWVMAVTSDDPPVGGEVVTTTGLIGEPVGMVVAIPLGALLSG